MNLEQEMLVALKCVAALEAPYSEGKATLEKYGYDHSNRFELKATEFVLKKVTGVLEKVK